MRLNVPPPAVFPAPDTLPVRGIDGARAVQPVNNEAPGNREPPAPLPVAQTYRRAPGETGFMEQRAMMARRGGERRRQQLAVMLDTRSGEDRRRQSRREQDEVPRSVNIKA